MRRKLTIIAIAIFAASLALAQQVTMPHTPGGQVARSHLEMWSWGLQMTEQQTKEAAAIMEASNEATKALRERIFEAQAALDAAVKKGAINEIDQIAYRIGVLQGQVLAAGAKSHVQVLALLTPEQKEKAASFPIFAAPAHSPERTGEAATREGPAHTTVGPGVIRHQ